LEYDENCIFCKIIRKYAPSTIIYENESVIAFLDIRPLNMGHTLVVPLKHYVDIFDIPKDTLGQVHIVSKQIAPAIKAATEADGISVIQQNGKAAGQDIFHLHVHVVPRFEGQKLPHFNELQLVEREKLDHTAEKIRQYL
jgi:histidine triad (HIT) family protein